MEPDTAWAGKSVNRRACSPRSIVTPADARHFGADGIDRDASTREVALMSAAMMLAVDASRSDVAINKRIFASFNAHR
jgi:hypothetical protein